MKTIIIALFISTLSLNVYSDSQKTYGDKSPIVNTKDGDVNITYSEKDSNPISNDRAFSQAEKIVNSYPEWSNLENKSESDVGLEKVISDEYLIQLSRLKEKDLSLGGAYNVIQNRYDEWITEASLNNIQYTKDKKYYQANVELSGGYEYNDKYLYFISEKGGRLKYLGNEESIKEIPKSFSQKEKYLLKKRSWLSGLSRLDLISSLTEGIQIFQVENTILDSIYHGYSNDILVIKEYENGNADLLQKDDFLKIYLNESEYHTYYKMNLLDRVISEGKDEDNKYEISDNLIKKSDVFGQRYLVWLSNSTIMKYLNKKEIDSRIHSAVFIEILERKIIKKGQKRTKILNTLNTRLSSLGSGHDDVDVYILSSLSEKDEDYETKAILVYNNDDRLIEIILRTHNGKEIIF